MNTNNQFAEALWVDLVRMKLEELNFGSIELDVRAGRVIRIASNATAQTSGVGTASGAGDTSAADSHAGE